MKKINFFALALSVVAVVGTSCSKEQSIRKEAGNAEVVLHLGVNNDLTNDTTATGATDTIYEGLPAGTEVRFTLDSRDLQANPAAYAYDELTFVGTVDAESKVTIELPASVEPMNVQVRFPDLMLQERKFVFSSQANEEVVETKDKLYTKDAETISIYEGAKVIRKYNY